MKRLLDVSVSILVVIALFMSQSWAGLLHMPIIQLTDLMIQTAFILKALLPIKLSLSLGGKNRMLAP